MSYVMQNVSQFGKLDVRATYVSVQASGYVSSASHISHQNDLHNDNNNKPAPTAAAATTRLSKLPYISPHASLLPPILPNTVIKFQSVRSEQKRRTTKPTPSGSLPLPLPSTPLPPPHLPLHHFHSQYDRVLGARSKRIAPGSSLLCHLATTFPFVQI